MEGALALYQSTIGKKVVMAVTGMILVGFVIVHMLGNLKVFAGPEQFNAYAGFLRDVGSPIFGHEQGLWLARIVLLGSAALHMVAAYQLTRTSWAGRPVAYARKETTRATYASRTMRWGGVILLLFVAYHILHFTVGAVGYAPGQFRETDVYGNVVRGFRVWYVSAFYIAAMAVLGLHLYHGVWSMFQTLGLNGAATDRFFRRLATVVSVGVVAGNISVPAAVLAGLVR
jgi:succinate dehydrogenase / fumarate reductase cytochrome b subunit